MKFRSLLVTLIRKTGLMPLASRCANAQYRLRKLLARRLKKSDIDVVYTRGFFRAEEEMTQPTAGIVTRIFLDAFQPASVVDVGCGTGIYLKEFAAAGVDIHGYEGSLHALEGAVIDPEHIEHHDLREPLDHDRRYDLVLCIEVAEHIDRGSADQLVATLTGLGDHVAFTAAQPGQGGTDHVNEQPPGYWIDKFTATGFTHDPDLTARLRTRFAEEDCVWWLVKNLLVFHRDGEAAGGSQ